ncbi:type 1 glutamine amidotransferase [Arenibacterium sp. CAU 1754]
MRLAILITNTDNSDFAKARPDDGEKFATLIREVRPDWSCDPYWVCRDEFPSDITGYDGVLITGSPASVSEKAPWMTRLETLIRNMVATGVPLFGACFGHQLIAKALGSRIIRNPDGWGHGRLEISRAERMPWSGPEQVLSLYGSHIEQVEKAPDNAQVTFSGTGCPVAGFALGDTVSTIQHHPEMTHAFITDLVEHYAHDLGAEVTETARKSLVRPADRTAFAEEIARFFEHAAAHVRKRTG